jgi:hypothetical protein
MNNSSIPNPDSWSIQTCLTDDSLTVGSSLLAVLEQAVLTSQSDLRDFAADPDFSTQMASIFGEETEEYNSWREAWLNNEFGILTNLEIRTADELGGANGAYSAQTDRIYLALEFLEANQENVDAIAAVLLEEAGHRLDAQVNSVDTAGDEGEQFSLVVQGENLSEETLTLLQKEDDSATFKVNGQTVVVEQAQSLVVTNTNDSGPGSLRQAILNANANPGTDTITFDIDGGGVQAIQPLTALPRITDSVIIDGTTQPGFTDTPLIELDGTNVGAGTAIDGLLITAGGSTVRGLIINRFGRHGINLSDGSDNVIEGNFIGTDVTGTISLGNGTGIGNSGSFAAGVFVESSNNIIGGETPEARNIIAGNGRGLNGSGVLIAGSNATGNRVIGNFLGTDVTGTVALNQSGSGVRIDNASENIIGGTTPQERNIISGNDFYGIRIEGLEAIDNKVIGNFIGTDATGTADLGNLGGIRISVGAANNTIGGTMPGARNVISGNDAGSGVFLQNGNTGNGNLVIGNFIGTDITGTQAIGNRNAGVNIRLVLNQGSYDR